MACSAAPALFFCGERDEALEALSAILLVDLRRSNWSGIRRSLSNISVVLSGQNLLAKEERCLLAALDLASMIDQKEDQEEGGLFRSRLNRFCQLAVIGHWTDAEAMWKILDPMGRDWPRTTYRPGDAESHYAQFRFWLGDLREEHLAGAERLAKPARNRSTFRDLHCLRGEWQLEQDQWALAAESLHEAVRLAREVGQTDAKAEAQLALAKFHLNQLPDPTTRLSGFQSTKNPLTVSSRSFGSLSVIPSKRRSTPSGPTSGPAPMANLCSPL